ncbi:MAG TPA: SpoIIE family protein phosphatase [Miltoncostaeaceae bacterium]|nr:SpoIIE family protein phosphatase [Miltoncostaeaceae bacterium]
MLGGLNPARWLSRLASVAAVELPAALDEIAERIQEVFDVDVVEVHVADESDPEDVTRGYCVGPSSAAQALAPLLTPDGLDPIGLGDAAVEADGPVVWPRIVSEPAEIERLARLADEGGPAGALHRLMLDASGIAVPLGTPHQPGLGAVALVSLTRESPVPESHVEDLLALAPQIALTVRNHQLDARTRRTRQTLEGVISSSRMGVLVSDLRGRLSLANQAAADILGIDLEPLVGLPMRELVAERIKWRFTNPDDYGERMLAIHGDPTRTAIDDAETVDGRAIEHSSSPVRDPSGALVGRVDILTDVTPARSALAEARRLAAERAELLEREERRAQEEVALSRAAHMMASALTPSDIHDHLLDQTHRLTPACHKSAVLAVDRRGLVVPVATRGFADETIKRMVFKIGEGVVGGALAGRRPFVCNDAEAEQRISSRITGPEGIRSFMNVPLVLGDRVYGLLTVNSAEVRAFGERDLRVVGELARHAASALQNALQFEQERHIAETLQQALIAEELPALDGLELAALYQAAAGSQVGGDFYSAWPLGDGRLALLVGDVSGKGVEAAGTTAMVRYMAEALSQHRCEPAAVVSELNALLHTRLPDGGLVTLVLAVLDTGAGTLAWCSAGHPPPVLVDAAGGQTLLEDPGPPCGAFEGAAFTGHEVPFPPGGVLVLYTDGILEARRDGREFGEEGLSEVLRDAHGEGPVDIARSVYGAARTWSGGRLSDDVAIAVARRVATAG